MGLAVVNRVQAGAGAADTTIVAPAVAHAAGNAIVVLTDVIFGSGVATSVTNTGLDTFVKIGEFDEPIIFNRYEAWVCLNSNGNAADVVTVNLSASTSFRTVAVIQVSGQDRTGTGDVKTGFGTSTAIATAILNVATSEEIILAIMSGLGPPHTGGAGYTLNSYGLDGGTAYYADETKIVAASEAATATMSTSGDWGILGVILKAAPATFTGPVSVPNRLVGPVVLRRRNQAKTTWSQLQLSSDMNFILPTYPIDPKVGPVALRRRNRIKTTWSEIKLPSDTNFGFPLYPANQVGPQVLRQRRRPQMWRWGTLAGAAAYSLTLDPGAYGLTGAAATLLASRLLSLTAGSYTISGAAATLRLFRVLAATAGAYNITGSVATFRRSLVLQAVPGVYTVTGATARLIAAKLFTASAGSYAITGAAAAIVARRVLAATPGSYTITGRAATLLATRLIGAIAGAYNVTGKSASLVRSLLMGLSPGAYVISGNAATLVFTPVSLTAYTLALNAGAYAVTGKLAGAKLDLLVFPTGGMVLIIND